MIWDRETKRFCVVEVWEGVDHEANTKMRGSKYKMTYICPHTYKQANIPVFQCVFSESVSLARQLETDSTVRGPTRLVHVYMIR